LAQAVLVRHGGEVSWESARLLPAQGREQTHAEKMPSSIRYDARAMNSHDPTAPCSGAKQHDRRVHFGDVGQIVFNMDEPETLGTLTQCSLPAGSSLPARSSHEKGVLTEQRSSVEVPHRVEDNLSPTVLLLKSPAGAAKMTKPGRSIADVALTPKSLFSEPKILTSSALKQRNVDPWDMASKFRGFV